ncbi:MAG: glucose-1-phosphate thymidylyltransferase RfbA [Akkermansia sp.]|nr:glucose-1-phosphate thymidylyltransferase RfbA [Akkermansia sp.]
MKGIVLAGGSGTRLYPITRAISKQLIPIFDKPMIYYPLSVLMLADIREILVISTPQDLPAFRRLLGDGSDFGLKLSYAEQRTPAGIAEAFIIGREFIGEDDVCLILGDHLLYGNGLTKLLKEAVLTVENTRKAAIFAYPVATPEQYGVVELSADGKCLSLEEKPATPKSNYAVIGLYFYPNDVLQLAPQVSPSPRGELEITAVNEMYMQMDRLQAHVMGHGYAWLDTGTHDAISEASTFVEVIEKRQGFKIACLEAIAFRKGWIGSERLEQIAATMMNTQYGRHLYELAQQHKSEQQ